MMMIAIENSSFMLRRKALTATEYCHCELSAPTAGLVKAVQRG
jgi:hypothetical protein